MLLILVVFIVKAFGTLKPLKAALKQYEKSKDHINYKKMDVRNEIDDILSNFEKKEKGVKEDGISTKNIEEKRA
ncbi:unnamed protein product [marine sediment metagenome]|uniref:Uncharacterized protein n=1 Tax=marine sediment metagenome TaxID=412755 RepID=X0T6Z0_9ZZZZ